MSSCFLILQAFSSFGPVQNPKCFRYDPATAKTFSTRCKNNPWSNQTIQPPVAHFANTGFLLRVGAEIPSRADFIADGALNF